MQSKSVINDLTAIATTYARKGDVTEARNIVTTIEGKLIIIEINNTVKKQRSI